ncbi:MAG: hypothetical protein RLZ26_1971 [Pseudomonadota bacterium]|jgi:hypothetical protein
MSDVASLQSYRLRRYPHRDFRIDPVTTIYVALDGMLKGFARLQSAPEAERASVAEAERLRILRGVDFIFESIDLRAGGLASGLISLLLRHLRERLVEGFAAGRTEFTAEEGVLRDLHALFAAHATGQRDHG